MLAQSALVWALVAPSWLPTGLRWDQAQTPTVPYCITANGTRTNVSEAGQRQSVTNGIEAWVSTGSGGNLSCSTFRAAPSTSGCRTSVNTTDSQNNFFWEDSWGNGSSTIGVTWSQPTNRNCGQVTDDTGQTFNLRCVFGADIELNDRDFFWTNSGNNGTDIESIMAHEFGHFIGMDHCSDNGTCGQGQAVMFAAYIGGNQRALRNDDVQGGCALYPGQPGGFAWPCTANGQCNSGICANAGPDGYCSQTCGSCPNGFICDPDPTNPNRDICLRDDGLNKAVCETCQVGVANACRNNGLCFSNIPDARCVEPCVNGTCADNRFNCVNINNGQQTIGYCLPRSSNCNNLNNFMTLQFGQPCSQNGAPCADGLECQGICTVSCDSMACPAGYGCLELTNGGSYCYPEVNEGADCSGLRACSTGPCLINPQTQVATCYLDCADDPNVCNNAQMCNTYGLNGGGSVSICEPPGVPPNPPDAGVPDLGPPPDMGNSNPDMGNNGNMDAGVNPPVDMGNGNVDAGNNACSCNTSNSCDNNCGCDPDCNTGCPCDVTDNACDDGCFCDNDCGSCACDITVCCDTDPNGGGNCGCDPECNSGACGCDIDFGCSPDCACDPECVVGCGDSSGCSTALPVKYVNPLPVTGLWAGIVVAFGLWLRRRKRI